MCTVSVIVPFYNGNRFLVGLHDCLEHCCCNFEKKVEVIVVNDSPKNEVEKEKLLSDKYELKIINHSQNEGIHQARVTGLEYAKGEYILFLDQDDKVDNSFFREMVCALDANKLTAFAFANGVFDDSKGKSKLILNSYGKVLGAQNYKTYLRVGNLLASPGQCLIRKSMIPKVWTTNIMRTNCADDFLLWILMIKKKKGIYVNKLLYHHISTGENTSANKLNGYISDLEVCEIFRNERFLTLKEFYLFEMRCKCNFSKEKGEKYSRLGWFCARLIEVSERIKMKIMGAVLFLLGKKVVGIKM